MRTIYTCGVYKLYFGRLVYIGASTGCEHRWVSHKCLLRKGIHLYQKEFQAAFECGVLKFVVLEKCTAENLHNREQEWMDRYPRRINRSRFVTPKGCKHTDEWRLKMRLLRLGKKRGPMSQEQKEKLRKANLGKILTDKHREKIRQWNLGRPRDQGRFTSK